MRIFNNLAKGLTNPFAAAKQMLSGFYRNGNIAKLDSDEKKNEKLYVDDKWNVVKELDCTQVSKLGSKYSNPQELKKVVVMKDQVLIRDQVTIVTPNLALDTIRTNLRHNQRVKVEVMDTKQNVLKTLMENPNQLTPRMAENLSFGDRGNNPLKRSSLEAALLKMSHSLDDKWPSIEIRNILLGGLSRRSETEGFQVFLSKLKPEFLTGTNYAQDFDEIQAKAIGVATTQKVLTDHMKKIENEILKTDLKKYNQDSRAKIAKIIAEYNIARIQQQADKMSADEYRTFTEKYSNLMAKIGGGVYLSDLESLCALSLAKLEDLYEARNVQYNRISERTENGLMTILRGTINSSSVKITPLNSTQSLSNS